MNKKKWRIEKTFWCDPSEVEINDIITVLLNNRGLTTKREIELFLNPPDPSGLSPADVGIDTKSLNRAIGRTQKAIRDNESIVVYADYDADGITAGAILWETLHGLGAKVMPYIPHRVEEGYGLSKKGIDNVKKKYNPSLLITVDHGITGWEKVAYAASLGMEVIVTDHHVKPKKLPKCLIVHTTTLSGAGVSWFVANALRSTYNQQPTTYNTELLSLAAIGTIADMMPLAGPNRSIAKFGLAALSQTKRVGLVALIIDAGLAKGSLTTYDVSHILAPRLNAMGRLVHAMDALRLLCTKRADKAAELARTLGLTNKERQQLTMETTGHALQGVALQGGSLKKLVFVAHESYNQGVIGLVAGKLVEEYYRPAIVVSRGTEISKASARSIAGFNIVEAIRRCSDILIDVGGHPMAAGFTVETRHLQTLQDRLEQIAERELNEDTLTRVLRVDAEIPLEVVTERLWTAIQDFQPFGFGNPEPVFATRGVAVMDARKVGAEGKHLKLVVAPFDNVTMQQFNNLSFDAIAFNMGSLYGKLRPGSAIDIAYTIDMNVWNGNKKLQLKIRDIHP